MSFPCLSSFSWWLHKECLNNISDFLRWPWRSNSKVEESPPSRTIISIDETPEGQKIYWGEALIDMSQIGFCVKKNPEWKVFLRVHPKVTHASGAGCHERRLVVQAEADVIFGTWQTAG